MKRYLFYFLFFASSILLNGCGNLSHKETAKKNDVAQLIAGTKVSIIYFHGNYRCATCDAIRELSMQYIEENFSEREDVKLIFLDYTDPANRAWSDKYQVAFTSLIVAGEQGFTDLTNIAFAHILRNPDRVRTALDTEVKKFLEK